MEFFHGYTYSGHPVACAAAIATLELFEKEKLFPRAGEMGKVLGDAFHSAFKGLPNVIGIRSLGLAAAVELAPIAGLTGQAGLRHLPGLLSQGRAGAARGRRAGDRAALHRREVAHRHAGQYAGGFDQEERLTALSGTTARRKVERRGELLRAMSPLQLLVGERIRAVQAATILS